MSEACGLTPAARGTDSLVSYAYYDVARTWSEARDYCARCHSNLASMLSEGDNDEFVTLARTVSIPSGDEAFGAWIGGTALLNPDAYDCPQTTTGRCPDGAGQSYASAGEEHSYPEPARNGIQWQYDPTLVAPPLSHWFWYMPGRSTPYYNSIRNSSAFENLAYGSTHGIAPWYGGEPNNVWPGEYCALIWMNEAPDTTDRIGRWNDYECRSPQPFLCEDRNESHDPLQPPSPPRMRTSASTLPPRTPSSLMVAPPPSSASFVFEPPPPPPFVPPPSTTDAVVKKTAADSNWTIPDWGIVLIGLTAFAILLACIALLLLAKFRHSPSRRTEPSPYFEREMYPVAQSAVNGAPNAVYAAAASNAVYAAAPTTRASIPIYEAAPTTRALGTMYASAPTARASDVRFLDSSWKEVARAELNANYARIQHLRSTLDSVNMNGNAVGGIAEGYHNRVIGDPNGLTQYAYGGARATP